MLNFLKKSVAKRLSVQASFFFYGMLILLLQDGGTDCLNLYELGILPTVCVCILLAFVINGDCSFIIPYLYDKMLSVN